MRAFFALPLLLVALALSGCTSTSSTPSFPAVENYVGDAPSVERVDGYAEAVAESYRLLYEVGMHEVVSSAGDDYILSYAPQENFYAGLYNPEVEGVILIEDEDYFTVASAHLALQDPATLVIETANGLSLNHPALGNFTIVIHDGLVVSGFDNDGEWTGSFFYEPDPMVTKLVLEQLAERDQ
jgi:hypothetical protein